MYRGRRLRRNEAVRKLVRETRISVEDLVYPLFVANGAGIKREVSAMPGVFNFSIDMLMVEIDEIYALGLKNVLLFGVVDECLKDETGTQAYCDGNIVAEAISGIKKKYPDMCVIADVCLCEYTSHGHCGVIVDGCVHNDLSLPYLAKAALSYAKAGADMVAPSDMMDGRVAAIREILDENGLFDVSILSYAAKYASAFYGPFREAAGSAPKHGDRKSYQMDPANRREALKEVLYDIDEGADAIIVKPASLYLDILTDVKENTCVPIAAYNVSGEYSMIKAAGKLGYMDEKRAAAEMLISIKRAGADCIISYFAKEFANGTYNDYL